MNIYGQVGWRAAATVNPVVSDADALAFITAAAITDTTQKSAINTLVTQLKNYGIWTKMKALYPFVGGNASAHKFNLKDPRDLDAAYRLVFNGGWTHSATGALPNGSTGYADTQLNQNTSMVLGNEHISYYSRTNTTGLLVDIGVWNSITGGSQILSRNNYLGSDSFLGYVTDANTSYILNNDSRGFFMANRPSTTQLKLHKNSSINAFANNVTSKVNGNFWIGARSINTTAYLFTTRECAFSSIGDGLTDTEASNFYTAVQAYQTTLGRAV
jgi:hypothetical protein